MFGLSLAIARLRSFRLWGPGDRRARDKLDDIRAGSVEVLYGRGTGPSARGAQIWSQVAQGSWTQVNEKTALEAP